MGNNDSIELKNFSIGSPRPMKYGAGKEMNTGIRKETVEEAFLTKEGFRGDGVSNTRSHGGPDRAVCVYPYEHYLQWEQEFEQPLPAAIFGENLTVVNMLEADVHIGDIFQLGNAVIQITQGRIPCSTITKRTNQPLLLKRMVETGFTGYLCRVLEEGTVRRDSTIALIERHPKQVSVLFGNETYFQNPKDSKAIKMILEVPELAQVWKESLEKRLSVIGK